MTVRHGRPRGKPGMSLIEIVISMALFGAALLPVYDLIGKGAQISRTNEQEVTAAHLAAELSDQIACIPYRYLPTITDRSLPNADNGAYLMEMRGRYESFNPTLLTLSPLPKGFERVLSIETFSTSPNCCLKKVTVKILWGVEPRRNHTVTSLVEWRP